MYFIYNLCYTFKLCIFMYIIYKIHGPTTKPSLRDKWMEYKRYCFKLSHSPPSYFILHGMVWPHYTFCRLPLSPPCYNFIRYWYFYCQIFLILYLYLFALKPPGRSTAIEGPLVPEHKMAYNGTMQESESETDEMMKGRHDKTGILPWIRWQKWPKGKDETIGWRMEGSGVWERMRKQTYLNVAPRRVWKRRNWMS